MCIEWIITLHEAGESFMKAAVICLPLKMEVTH